MIDRKYHITKIRYSFIDAQNKAAFKEASKNISKEMTNLMIDNTYSDTSIKLWSSSKKIIFKITIDDKSFLMVLKRYGKNYEDYFDDEILNNELIGSNFRKVIEVNNKEIALKLIELIESLFIGNNFGLIEKYI